MFRKEALENRDKTWCGKAVLLPGLSSRLVIITSALFFVCFIVLISTGTYTRRISVQGEVTTWPRPLMSIPVSRDLSRHSSSGKGTL